MISHAVRRWSLAGWIVMALAVLLVFALSEAASACPTCKAGLAASGGHLVSAYMWSILFLMAMPFTLLTGFSGYMYWLVRRSRTQPPTGHAAAREVPAAEAHSADAATHELVDA